ncbi:hypothetical protein PEC106664_13770 [Pectobacterium carotovorum subsp. carotovorum]|nr:hypothetical protein PEC106664_13770 [Pectobacterium carotovorum subsp. carotovorum]
MRVNLHPHDQLQQSLRYLMVPESVAVIHPKYLLSMLDNRMIHI